MVDSVFQLERQGHAGPVVAVSRRGLLPQPHRRSSPLKIEAADVPLGTDVSYLMRWFRRTVDWTTERGGDWRDVVDGIRPQTQRIWQSLPIEARERFLRHARAFWEVHRHRIPPESDARLRRMISNGRLRIVTGRLIGLESEGEKYRAIIRHRLNGSEERLDVGRVIDCTGILRRQEVCADGLTSRLLERGLARQDALGIGLDIDKSCALIDQHGRPSRRLYAAGPVTRSQFWEITAVPDIRVQAAMLAIRLRDDVAGTESRSDRNSALFR